jgi:hypothetical protein
MSNLVPGVLSSYFVMAVVLTLPASLVVLFAYRRAVRRGMSHRATDAPVGSAAAAPPPPRPRAHATAPPRQARPGAFADTTRLHARICVIYALAAIGGAAVLTGFYFAFEDVPWTPLRGFIFGYIFCWPIAPTLAALLARSRLGALRFAGGYALLGALLVVVWSLVGRFVLGHPNVSPLHNVVGYAQLLTITAAAPLAIVLVSDARKLRPVVPWVLAGLLMFSFGALALQSAFVRVLDVVSLRALLLKIGYTPLFMIASLPVGYLCWSAQRWLSGHYQDKGSSDIQLLVDAWWLTAIFSACASLATQIGWRALWALGAFVVYRGVVSVGLAWWRVSSSRPTPSRLLLLRVFGAPRRAEILFDAIAGQWRFEGNVNLIGAADLAGRTLDPGEMLSFVGGRLQSLFMRDADDLAGRMGVLDETRDPDGRFRVNEFFCFDDTWRPTLKALLVRSDVILMDLRGFSRQNAGCLFEMQKLAEGGRLGRTLFVIDQDSDEDLLHATLARALEPLGIAAGPTLDIARVTRSAPGELRSVLTSLRAIGARYPPDPGLSGPPPPRASGGRIEDRAR